MTPPPSLPAVTCGSTTAIARHAVRCSISAAIASRSGRTATTAATTGVAGSRSGRAAGLPLRGVAGPGDVPGSLLSAGGKPSRLGVRCLISPLAARPEAPLVLVEGGPR